MGVELALLAATAKKFVDFVRQLKGKDTNAIVTQLLAWATGIAVVFIAANVDVAAGVEVANHSLDQLGLWSQAALGVVIGSLGSVVKDLQSRKDEAPKLLPGRSNTTTDLR